MIMGRVIVIRGVERKKETNGSEVKTATLVHKIYKHVVSVMTLVVLTLTDYWTWYRTIMDVNLLGLGKIEKSSLSNLSKCHTYRKC